MSTEHTAGLIGAPIRRVEDGPLITGAACYTGDIELPGLLHMALLRSPYPHAKIVSIHTNAAAAIDERMGGDLHAGYHGGSPGPAIAR